jgi:crooked neck
MHSQPRTTSLPLFPTRYVHMEEMLREIAKARAVFDRWMAFEPDHAPWMAYVKVRRRWMTSGHVL